MIKEEKTIRAIQEAVPEIMELKFGRSLKNNGRTWIFIRMHLGKYVLLEDRAWKPLARRDEVFDIFDNLEAFEILGRDITLEDVLIALHQRTLDLPLEDREIFGIMSNGVFLTSYLSSLEWSDFSKRDWSWELGKPFHEQSRATKDFIGDLILTKQ